jgi:diaminohydroxyphosphoribosylaminopyrimidine deaminase/5-amino-6-(5-phosphoribosylamino)uracil reductase
MTPSAKDEHYMQRCIELARKGKGLTRQNPLVGSVVVCNDRIIGEGYHNEYGGPHAEVIAVRSVADPTLLKKSSLYVNLEPCAHYGKTPPCSQMIRDIGIPRIIIGSRDSNPEVSGKGIMVLQAGGAEIIQGVLENECRYLNRRFFTYHEQKRPYVILKWAQTSDGFIDIDRKLTGKTKPEWITDHTAKMLVHKWRSEEMSIMAGTDTILLDNPGLNVREWPGISPIRVVPDKNGRLTKGLQVLDGSSKTIIFSGQKKEITESLRYLLIPAESFEITDLLTKLYNQQILSVFVEGGAKLIRNFIDSGLWDECRVFYGLQKFGSGVKAPEINCEPEENIEFRGSAFRIFRNNPLNTKLK